MDRFHLAAGHRAGRAAGRRALDAAGRPTAIAPPSMPARPRSRSIAPRPRIYRDNLASAAPSLWVALRPTGVEPPYAIVAVTADPAEGESFTQAGDDLVEAVPMPPPVRDLVAAFVAEHHVERPFVKRERDRADPEASGAASADAARTEPNERARRLSCRAGRAASSKRSRRPSRTAAEAAAADASRLSRRARAKAPIADELAQSELAAIETPRRAAVRSRNVAADRIDHRRDRHPRLPGAGRAGGAHPCGAAPRLGGRSEHPGFRRARRLRVGLPHARLDARLRPARNDRRADAANGGRIVGAAARPGRCFRRRGAEADRGRRSRAVERVEDGGREVTRRSR